MKSTTRLHVSILGLTAIIAVAFFAILALAPTITWTTDGDWSGGTHSNTTSINGGLMLNNTIVNGTTAIYSWFYNNWTYKKQITINGSTSLQNDYQVMINLTNRTASSDNFNFARANPQGNDTRFTWLNTTSGLEQNISFWIENWTASGSLGNATLWVKVPNVTASSMANTTLYMYYGNPSATYNNSLGGNNTFEFFDDFNTWDTTKWQRYGAGTDASITVSNGIMHINLTNLQTLQNFSRNIVLSAMIKRGVASSESLTFGEPNWDFAALTGHNGIRLGRTLFDAFNVTSYTQNSFINDWSIYKKRTITWAADLAVADVDGATNAITTHVPSAPLRIILGEHSSGSTNEEYVDWLFVRNYTSPEPSALSIGAEQTARNRGTYLSNTTTVSVPIASITPTWNATNSTNVNFTVETSANNGANWLTATNNTQYTSGGGIGSGTQLVYRVNFSTNDTGRTAVLSDINITYTLVSLQWSNNATSPNSPQTYNTGNNYGFQINWSSNSNNFANATFQLGRPSGTLTNYTSSWFYSNWTYRKTININGSASLLNDYQVLINLTNRTAGSDNFNFARANSQGNDTRFTWLNTSSGLEQNISFWIENWTASGGKGNATIWVKVPNVTASSMANTTLYMYYGNPSAASASSGANTFELFDDFSGTSLDAGKWTSVIGDVGTVTVSGGNLKLYAPSGLGEGARVISTSNFSIPYRLKATVMEENIDNTVKKGTIGINNVNIVWRAASSVDYTGSQGTSVVFPISSYNVGYAVDGTIVTSFAETSPNWHVVDIRVPSNSTTTLYYDGAWKYDSGAIGNNTNPVSIKLSSHNVYVGVNTNFYIDYIFVSKYASPEPNVLSIGNEQTSDTWYINFTQDQLGGTGTYNYTWFGIDTAGAQNKSDTVNYVINIAPTSARLFLNGTEGNRNYNLSQTANFTITLNISGKTVYLSTNLTGWSIASGTTPFYNYTQLQQSGIYNITGYFLGDENYSASSETYFANVSGIIANITLNLALHLGSLFADDSKQASAGDICISDGSGWFGLTAESPTQAQSGNLSADYRANASFTSDNKAYLAFGRGGCANFRNRAADAQLERFLSPLAAFSYPKTNLIQLILQFNATDLTTDSHWGKGTYLLSIANQGYNSTSGKQMLAVKVVK